MVAEESQQSIPSAHVETRVEVTQTSPRPVPFPPRAHAILRAVAAGRVQTTLSCEPDLFIDGLACCDQPTAHRLSHAGLIRPKSPGHLGQRVPAVLTAAGTELIDSAAEAA